MEPSISAASSSRKENFARLQEEHAKVLHASRERISKWEQFRADYDALQARLQTLPEKVTHDIMVPFGHFAFMPGQLYHTNEILVLLGDNWFAERSAKQAIEIAERRKQYVTKLLEDEKRQFSDWEARYAFAADFKSTLEEHEDTVEIREEYKPEKKEAKRYTAPKESKAPPPRKVVLPPVAPKEGRQTESTLKVRSDEEIWARLDELEREEKEWEEEESLQREKRIADSLKEDTEKESRGTKYQERNKNEEGSKDTNKLDVKQRTGLEDVQSGALEQRQPSKVEFNQPFSTKDVALNTDKSSDGQTRKGEEESDGCPLTIIVTHVLPQPPALAEEPASQEDEQSKEKALFTSPGDIFMHFCKPQTKETEVKQISVDSKSQPSAKSVRWDPKLVSYHDRGKKTDGGGSTEEQPKSKTTHVQPKRSPTLPFSGQVVERSAPTSSIPAQESPRKVSRFKASRRKD